ncbi:MAG: hypothetical protein DMD65_12670 [Gemmatimonadetes bacterium]|nr:MAG: hypothetical protein DMD65_12670 [Gemmatimonadota bacterium]
MKRNLFRVLLLMAKSLTGFEVALVVCSPLAYLVVRALAALCFSARRLRMGHRQQRRSTARIPL